MKKVAGNQKVVKVNKEACNKQNLYATINLDAMGLAACNLDAGAFKLWCYFAKNQNGYEFALSSKDAGESFGIKIKQYNNAVSELTEKGYLLNTKGNNYMFYEIPVITKEDNPVITKEDKGLSPKEITNITDTTNNNTLNITEEKGTIANPQIVTKGWLIEHHNELVSLANRLFNYKGIIVKEG